ncbi:MAG: transcriptional repressor LexA [Elusimicrobiota bacterium]
MRKITDRQKKVLDFIEEHLSSSGHAPTVRETAARFNVNIGAAQKHISALVRKGYVKHSPGISRGLDIASRTPHATVPVLGRVPAGSPVPPIEDIEGHVHIDRDIAGKGDCFALKVKGDSMTGAGILEGDIVVVRHQQTADSGDIVVAMAGGEATVKKLRKKGRDVYLEPANPKYRPIHSNDIRIIGKVVYLSRKI